MTETETDQFVTYQEPEENVVVSEADENGAVSETAGDGDGDGDGGGGSGKGSGRGRGRPRAADTLARDEQVVELLRAGPQTVAQLAEAIGVERGKTYLCIYRLRQNGRVERVKIAESRHPGWRLVNA
jgi:hypothetical protein